MDPQEARTLSLVHSTVSNGHDYPAGWYCSTALQLTGSEEVRTLSLVHHSAAMDMIAQEAGTVALFHFQGRVVVVVMDMADMGLVQLIAMDLLGLEQNPQEGACRDCMVVDKVVEQQGEGGVESLLAVWNEMQ